MWARTKLTIVRSNKSISSSTKEIAPVRYYRVVNKDILVCRILEFWAGGFGYHGWCANKFQNRDEIIYCVHRVSFFFLFFQKPCKSHVCCIVECYSRNPRVEKEFRPGRRYRNEQYDDGIIIIFVNPYKLYTLLPAVRFQGFSVFNAIIETHIISIVSRRCAATPRRKKIFIFAAIRINAHIYKVGTAVQYARTIIIILVSKNC